MIIDDLTADVKQAMLSGNKELAAILRDLKSAVLYEQVAQSKRDGSPDDNLVVSVLSKELKKRKDAISLYEKANDAVRLNQELKESQVIEKYLPARASETEIKNTLELIRADSDIDFSSPRAMGQVITEAKQRLQPKLVDGALLAKTVKEYLAA